MYSVVKRVSRLQEKEENHKNNALQNETIYLPAKAHEGISSMIMSETLVLLIPKQPNSNQS